MTMENSANALQKAVFEALNADAALGALVAGRIFDGRPLRRDCPHVSFGEWRITDLSTATEHGEEHRFDIEVWSEKNGHLEVAQIASAVNAVLHDRALSVTGFHLINLRHQTTRTARESRTRLMRARMSFRAVLEPGA